MRRSEVFCTLLYASLQLHFDLHRLTVFPACIFSNYRGFDVSFRFSWIRISSPRPLFSVLSLFLISLLHHSSTILMPRRAKQRRSHQSHSSASRRNRPSTPAAPPSRGGNRVQSEPEFAAPTRGPDGRWNMWKCTYPNCSREPTKHKSVS